MFPRVLILIMVLAGCLTSSQVGLASLPPEGTAPFAALSWECSLKPLRHVIVVYANQSMGHATLQYSSAEAGRGEFVLPPGLGGRLLQDAASASGLNISSLEESDTNLTLVHVESVRLSDDVMEGLRRAAAAAELAGLEERYEETSIMDACAYTLGTWVGDDYDAVRIVSGAGPEALQAYLQEILDAHPL